MGTAIITGDITMGSFHANYKYDVNGDFETVAQIDIPAGKKESIEIHKAGKNLVFLALKTNAEIEVQVGDDKFPVLRNTTFLRQVSCSWSKLDFKKVEIKASGKEDAHIEIASLYMPKG